MSRSATAPFDRLKVFLITHTPKETHKRKTGSLVKAFWAIYGENGRPRIRNFWVGNGLSVAKSVCLVFFFGGRAKLRS